MFKSTMTNARKLAVPAVLVMFALVAAACGGDDDSGAPTDSPLVQAIAASADSDPDSPLSNREDAECFASKIVGDIGEDRLAELGVTAENAGSIDDIDFSSDELGVVVDSLDDCVDLKALMAEEFEEDFGAEAAGCLADELDGDVLKDAMRAGFSDEEPTEDFIQAFLDVAAKCDLPLG